MFEMHEDMKKLLVESNRIRPHQKNPNNGDVERIIESLTANGCYRPIFAMRDTGEIVAGHHLYSALLAHGHTSVPVSWVDRRDGQVDLRVLLADNRTASMARLDEGLAIDVLEGLDDTFGTGFTVEELAEMKAAEDHFYGGAPSDTFEEFKREVTCPDCGSIFTPDD